MVDQSLSDRKLDASKQLVGTLLANNAPLLAAYWEWTDESGRWVFYLVPKSTYGESQMVDQASKILVQSPFRSIFSLSDAVVDARQSERARALGNYIRVPRDIGRRFDTTFTGGHYFEGVIVVYVAPEISRQHSVA